jgi:hypothetical protein
VTRWKIADEVYIDGSFVSAKPSPGDVDLVICLREEFALRAGEWTPAEQNLVDKAFVKRTYEIDLWPAVGDAACAARRDMFAR